MDQVSSSPAKLCDLFDAEKGVIFIVGQNETLQLAPKSTDVNPASDNILDRLRILAKNNPDTTFAARGNNANDQDIVGLTHSTSQNTKNVTKQFLGS